MNRIEGSGQPRSITIYENTNLIEELICSQEEALHTHTHTHTHLALCKIAEQTGISRLTI